MVRKKIKQEKKDNELKICKVCCFDIPLNKCLTCSSKHVICETCFLKTTENLSTNRSSSKKIIKGFSCFVWKCTGYINYESSLKLLPSYKQNLVQKAIQNAMIVLARIKVSECPKCNICSEATNEKVVSCPYCSFVFCSICKKECDCNHDIKKCFMNQKTRENLLSDALIHRCYKCKLPFIKRDGCNYITCKCGATQCYNCRKPMDMFHFCTGSGLSTEQIHKRDVDQVSTDTVTSSLATKNWILILFLFLFAVLFMYFAFSNVNL